MPSQSSQIITELICLREFEGQASTTVPTYADIRLTVWLQFTKFTIFAVIQPQTQQRPKTAAPQPMNSSLKLSLGCGAESQDGAKSYSSYVTYDV